MAVLPDGKVETKPIVLFPATDQVKLAEGFSQSPLVDAMNETLIELVVIVKGEGGQLRVTTGHK